MMNCFEVDTEGSVIEYLFLDEEEIEKIREAGRLIITRTWEDQRLFTPKWDFQNNVWTEGLTDQEVSEKESIIQEQQLKMSNEDVNAIALMELAQLVYGGS